MSLSVNPWAVVLAASAGWLAGVGYYTLLAEAWVKGLGSNMDQLQREQVARAGTAEAWLPFLLAFVSELVMAWVLAGILLQNNALNLFSGLVSGALVWLGLVATTIAVNNTLAGRKLMLTMVDSGHWLLVLLVMGAVIGLFG